MVLVSRQAIHEVMQELCDLSVKLEVERKAREEAEQKYATLVQVYDAIEADWTRAESRLATLFDLLKFAKCPNCDGSGIIWRQGSGSDPEQEQCQWCFERSALQPEGEESVAARAQDQMPVGISSEPASAADLIPGLEWAAALFRGLYYGPYEHPSMAILDEIERLKQAQKD